jgi:hypothetical protein
MEKSDFSVENDRDWKKIHKNIFDDSIPRNCTWTDIDAIISVLNKIGSVKASNHMFFASGGGLDLLGARKSHEEGCIELLMGVSYLCKPKSLTFEYIDHEFHWNYFRLETDILKLTDVYEGMATDKYFEQVLEISPLHYVSRSHWDENEYEGKKLPVTARPIVRILKGSLVIFKKTSTYNLTSSTYDGRHDKFGPDAFRTYIADAYEQTRTRK